MSFILSSAALSRLVLVRDCANTDLETLAEVSALRSEEEVSLGLRFFYCTGLAISLLAMGAVSLSHEHKITLTCRLPKWARLLNRLIVCVIFFCLPAAEGLNSLDLIGVTTSLTVWVLFLEIWGKSCKEESFFVEDKDKCKVYGPMHQEAAGQGNQGRRRGGRGGVVKERKEFGAGYAPVIIDCSNEQICAIHVLLDILWAR